MKTRRLSVATLADGGAAGPGYRPKHSYATVPTQECTVEKWNPNGNGNLMGITRELNKNKISPGNLNGNGKQPRWECE